MPFSNLFANTFSPTHSHSGTHARSPFIINITAIIHIDPPNPPTHPTISSIFVAQLQNVNGLSISDCSKWRNECTWPGHHHANRAAPRHRHLSYSIYDVTTIRHLSVLFCLSVALKHFIQTVFCSVLNGIILRRIVIIAINDQSENKTFISSQRDRFQINKIQQIAFRY